MTNFGRLQQEGTLNLLMDQHKKLSVNLKDQSTVCTAGAKPNIAFLVKPSDEQFHLGRQSRIAVSPATLDYALNLKKR